MKYISVILTARMMIVQERELNVITFSLGLSYIRSEDCIEL